MIFTYTPSGSELSHHGILGMKWGIRRYQNKDGSLTNAGKRHVKENESQTDKDARRERNKKIAKRVAIGAAIVGGTILAVQMKRKLSLVGIKELLAAEKMLAKNDVLKEQLPKKITPPPIPKTEVPRTEIPRTKVATTQVKRTSVPRTEVPRVTVTRSNTSSEDSLERAKKNLERLKSVGQQGSSAVNNSDVDDYLQSLLRKIKI